MIINDVWNFPYECSLSGYAAKAILSKLFLGAPI